MKKKHQKSYSLSTEAIHLISLAAKEAKRNPSDWLDIFIIEEIKDIKRPAKKA